MSLNVYCPEDSPQMVAGFYLMFRTDDDVESMTPIEVAITMYDIPVMLEAKGQSWEQINKFDKECRFIGPFTNESEKTIRDFWNNYGPKYHVSFPVLRGYKKRGA